LCHRLAFLQAGRIVAAGTVGELQAAIGYGIRCDLHVRVVDGASLVALAGGPERATVSAPEAGSTAWRLETTVAGEDEVAALLGAIVRSGGAIVASRTRPPSLEEIYVRTLGPASSAEAGGRPAERVGDTAR
jgi:ABC-type multidrug transport system ATPase subunit